MTEDRSYLFVLTRAARVEVRVYPLAITQKDLTDLTERFRLLLSTVDNRFSQPARELYDLLLAPAAAQLRGKTRLVIVPDGPLWEVPFQALLTPRDRYLTDDHTVFYVPSLTVLQQMMQPRQDGARRPAKPTLLALGNPALGQRAVAQGSARMADDTLEPLPEAERQVQALQGMYGSSARKKLHRSRCARGPVQVRSRQLQHPSPGDARHGQQPRADVFQPGVRSDHRRRAARTDCSKRGS